MDKHLKILGLYLSIVALAHVCLYVVLNLFSERFGWLFYFDTRIGFFFIETIMKESEGTPPAITAWLIELGELAIGIAMFSGRKLVKVYAILESILTITYLLFFLLIIVAGMSGNHGFSPAELTLPSVAVIIGSIFPLCYAIWILWRFRLPNDLSIV